MKKYILKYKLLNLIHIILIGFSSAFLVGASVTLSIMLNKLVESDFKGFLIWLGIEFGVYLSSRLFVKSYLCLNNLNN